MEDNLSVKSSDSVTTSGEYEIVPETPTLNASGLQIIKKNEFAISPTLNIANNGNLMDLEQNMTECIHETEIIVPGTSFGGISNPNTICMTDLPVPEITKVGQSVFYDCTDMSPTTEKQDDMKPERSDTEEEMSDIDQDCTVFSGVTYLGCAKIDAPKSETEILRNMSELNSVSNFVGMKVSVSIPSCSDGHIVLYDGITNSVSAHYEVHRILFYARGEVGTNDEACFAFTWSHGDSQESAIFQCHVFRCQIPEAVVQVSSCFARAFQRIPSCLTGSVNSPVEPNNSMIQSITSDVTGNPITSAEYEFIVSLEIREKLGKNPYQPVPRERSFFKLRCNLDKEVCITVKQTPSQILPNLMIERCFGVLLSPGKLVRQADMQLLDTFAMTHLKTDETQICAEWKAGDFEELNFEIQKTHLTVAVDLVIKGITEPVRFIIETPVTILSQSEWRLMEHFISKRSMKQRFYLHLKDSGEGLWEVQSIDPSEEIKESTPQSSGILKFGFNNLSKMVRSTSAISLEPDELFEDNLSDGDEPLLSGTGEVSKECNQESLSEWGVILTEWNDDVKKPKSLNSLVRAGVPEALRGKIWQKLANVENNTEMTERYRVLLTKETNCEPIIQRDIHRTFPAHKFFKEMGGSGQDALFKVSKAYAVYDTEVGYCQGLSFVSASLLLHMPEEEAFAVLVSLMYDYGLRDLYKHGFESLYLRLYQLNRLMKDQLPKLFEHFEKTGIETHMFASQWFLTLFTARFPLYFVFHILDVFLLEGMPILFQTALTLLSVCEADLKQLDFEGILKYIRVSLPKKCRNVSQAKKLMKMACEKKVKRLKLYEEEFINQKNLEIEVKAYEQKFNEERKEFTNELKLLNEKIDTVTEKASINEKKNMGIILDYKQIIQRQEQQITKLNEILEDVTVSISRCSTCSSNIAPSSPLHKTFGNLTLNKQMEHPLGPLDPLNIALQRVRELELELAQTKLDKVEAECKNQDLNHQLNTTLTEIQSNRSSWQPWLSKTLNSIQEKVQTKRDGPTFQSYTSPETNQVKPSNSPKLKGKLSQRNSLNRHSFDTSNFADHDPTLNCNSLK